MPDTRTIVLYHANCPDGFGGAYAAWKKFGDSAEYIPLKHGKKLPEGLTGARLYFIDFCYPKEIMDKLVTENTSLTVLDHHIGMKDVVESMTEFIFDENRSGSTIAWSYFHPHTTTPKLLKYLEDDDLFRFVLPDTRPIVRYLSANPFSFTEWDVLMHKIDDPTIAEELLVRLRNYSDYFDTLVAIAVDRAKIVRFEGYECYFTNSHPFITMRSAVGNALVQKKPPIALIVSAHPEGLGISLRSDGSVDTAKIAQKYGGGGHAASSGFSIAWGDSLPWTMVEKP